MPIEKSVLVSFRVTVVFPNGKDNSFVEPIF
jgi:hypothetical protein